MRALKVVALALSLAAVLAAASAGRKLSHVTEHHLVYSAHADVNGDGRPDLVSLHRHPATTGHLTVRLSSGRTIRLKIRSDAPFVPGLARVGEVNGSRGQELFVDLQHFSTNEVIGVFTYARGRLHLAQKLIAYSSDFPIRNGIRCEKAGKQHRVLQYEFRLHVNNGHWRWFRRLSGYKWHGSALRLSFRQHFRRFSHHPPADEVGVGCGSRPRK